MPTLNTELPAVAPKLIAGWCAELGQSLRLTHPESDALLTAAANYRLRDDDAELGLGSAAGKILDYLHGQERDWLDRSSRLARVIEMAIRWEHWTQTASRLPVPLSESIAACSDEESADAKAVRFVVSLLRKGGEDDLASVFSKLPVYPAIAMQLFALLSDGGVSLGVLEQMAKSDQVLAGKLMKASNSAFYSPAVPIYSVGQAIGFIGVQDAQRILLASALQPLFANENAKALWQHSLETAALADSIARMTGDLDPGFAFLLGLLHDSGKLAFSLLPGNVDAIFQRLIDSGASRTAVETAVCGMDHAQSGAAVLASWKFPELAIDAVLHQCRPEATPNRLASVLYVTNVWTENGSDQDHDRYRKAVARIGLSDMQLRQARAKKVQSLSFA